MPTEDRVLDPKKALLHHAGDGCACALCGDTARPLAFHLLEGAYPKDVATPAGFLVTAMTVEALHGVFPVCDQCAPPCALCQLPVETARVGAFKASVGAHTGKGVCPLHKGIGGRLKAIVKRTLKL